MIRRIIHSVLLVIVLCAIGYAWYYSWRISLAYWSTVALLLLWWVDMHGVFDRRRE